MRHRYRLLPDFLEVVAALGCYASIAAISARVQPGIDLAAIPGWDAAIYARMAEQIAAGAEVRVPAPFAARVGVPALAAVLSPGDVIAGLRTINIVAGAVLVALLVVWLRRWLAWPWTRLGLVSGLCLCWLGPARGVWLMPTMIDVPLLALVVTGFLLVQRIADRGAAQGWEIGMLMLLSVAAALVRETGLLLPLALLAARPRAAVAPLLAGVAASVIARVATLATGDYTFWGAALAWGYARSPASFVLALLSMYGPALVLLLLARHASLAWLREQRHLAAYGLAVLGLAWIGGTDLERFALWLVPVALPLIGRSIEFLAPRPWPAWLALGVAQVLALRPWPIPAYPDPAYLAQWAALGEPRQSAVLLAAHLSAVVVLGWLWRCSSRIAQATTQLTSVADDELSSERTKNTSSSSTK